ncbi:MAG: aldehyde ferredoxin oxidoreductase family protein [Candidatus Hodarchaeaceae archaeon]|nr:aldehyde ferredoxin oxidoreductase family protein [Candidatus Hodarchaeaceae archaeon]
MTFAYKGYTGKYLRVDLSRGKVVELPLKKEWARNYIGGSGMAARILYDEVPPEVEPLSPRNLLIFATGPVTGTVYPPSGRYCVVTRAPLTGIWGEAHSGGYFGPELKYAGYDLVVLQGRSVKPVYLAIDDGRAELRSAGKLWGKNTAETTDILEEEFGDPQVRVACIGPAGERLVKFACIMNEHSRAAGRTGVGAVMGSKNLKAAAVRGSKAVEVADFDRVWELTEEAHERYTGGEWGKALHDALYRYGTPGLVSWENEIGRLPTKGHYTGVFEYAEDIGPDRFEREFIVHRRSCMNCRMQCKKVSYVRSGPYAGTLSEGPEYETIVALGSNCLVRDFPAIMRANQLCNLYGMDTISCGGAVSFAMECFERGALTERELGMPLRWGDGDAMVNLVELIASREGIGDLLAEGVRAAAKRIGKGSERWAIHVKGLEVSGQDGRSHQSVGLTHAISVIGGAHLRALSSLDELDYRKTIIERYGKARAKELGDRLSTKYKGMLVKDVEDLYAIVDALITCKYGTMWPPAFYFDDYAKLLPAVTGIEEFASVGEVRAAAERMVNLKRAFNVRLGLDRRDDALPERFLKEQMPDGPAKGKVVDLKPMLDEYYRERGWDVRTGLQRRATLQKFGLDDVARDLAKRGKLR